MPRRTLPTRMARWRCLLLGATENDQRQFGDALTHLKAAGKRLPELADYVAYLSAVAEAGLRQFNDTESTLQPVWQSTPASPLVTKAVRCRPSRTCKAEIRRARSPSSSSIWLIFRLRKPSYCWRALMRRRIMPTPPRSIIKRSSSSIRCRRKRGRRGSAGPLSRHVPPKLCLHAA